MHPNPITGRVLRSQPGGSPWKGGVCRVWGGRREAKVWPQCQEPIKSSRKYSPSPGESERAQGSATGRGPPTPGGAASLKGSVQRTWPHRASAGALFQTTPFARVLLFITVPMPRDRQADRGLAGSLEASPGVSAERPTETLPGAHGRQVGPAPPLPLGNGRLRFQDEEREPPRFELLDVSPGSLLTEPQRPPGTGESTGRDGARLPLGETQPSRFKGVGDI